MYLWFVNSVECIRVLGSDYSMLGKEGVRDQVVAAFLHWCQIKPNSTASLEAAWSARSTGHSVCSHPPYGITMPVPVHAAVAPSTDAGPSSRSLW